MMQLTQVSWLAAEPARVHLRQPWGGYASAARESSESWQRCGCGGGGNGAAVGAAGATLGLDGERLVGPQGTLSG